MLPVAVDLEVVGPEGLVEDPLSEEERLPGLEGLQARKRVDSPLHGSKEIVIEYRRVPVRAELEVVASQEVAEAIRELMAEVRRVDGQQA